MTVHYSNSEKGGELQNRLIFLQDFPKGEPKSSSLIKNVLYEKTTSLGLSQDIFTTMTIVTDRGSNIVKALDEMGANRLNCSDHIL